MADILDIKESQGHTYRDEDGYVTVYTKTGGKPSRGLIFRLLSRARKALLRGEK